MKNMNFLNAEWRKLAFANYIINEDVLKPHIPYGTELDLWQGKCYISLVGMMFMNTKVLGVKIPYHVNFEEVNLRFYVKRFENGQWKRGVVFIKEIVPKKAITFVANNLYNENYDTMKMAHEWKEFNQKRTVSYSWGKTEKNNKLKMTAGLEMQDIEKNSETEFILENYLGFAKVKAEKTFQYTVKHPRWKLYDVEDYKLQVNYGNIYGKAFEFLEKMVPHSVFLVEGSEVAIENKKVLRP
jgi:uncharacterized protein YqjF (DUF2071 family)